MKTTDISLRIKALYTAEFPGEIKDSGHMQEIAGKVGNTAVVRGAMLAAAYRNHLLKRLIAEAYKKQDTLGR